MIYFKNLLSKYTYFVQLIFVFSTIYLIQGEALIAVPQYDWATKAPSVSKSKLVSQYSSWSDQCMSKFKGEKQVIPIKVDQHSIPKQTECKIANSDGVSLLTFNSTEGLAVKFDNESHAYAINDMDCLISCVYVPEKDLFLNVASINDVETGRVEIYKGFIQKVLSNRTEQSGVMSYNLNQPIPDSTISDYSGSEKYNGYIKYIQKSDNGKWIVLNYIDTGIFRLNLDTGQLHKFSDWRTSPGSSLEYDITDDGRNVAVMGLNSPGLLYEIDNACGLSLNEHPRESDLYQPQIKECAWRSVVGMRAEYLQDTRDVYQPRFMNGGAVLRFYARPMSFDGYGAIVTMVANGYSMQHKIDYLALGDSYSSGEGDTEVGSDSKKYYRLGTDVTKTQTNPEEKCHVSTRSYPYILANGMELGSPLGSALTRWQSIACSKATVWDSIGQAAQQYEGQGKRLEGFDQDSLKITALNEFIPGRQKQVEFVREYKPQAITLTMGGNDIGFGDKMKSCALNFGTCDVATEEGRKRFSKQIHDQFKTFKSLYEELYVASNKTTKIYVVGYPQFINPNKNDECGDLNIGMLNADERATIGDAVTYLNNVIEQAANAAGVKYIDIEDSLNGHRLCDSGKKYVTGIAARPPSEVQESFHPNAKGHYEMAMAIWGRVQNQSLIDYRWCEDVATNCPKSEATQSSIPEIPAFPLDPNQTKTVYGQFTAPAAKKGSVIQVRLPKYASTPGNPVKVSIREAGASIGDIITNQDGSLLATLTLPLVAQSGPQTIILEGGTYSGEPIVREQIIDIHGPDDDIDDDGIKDISDACLFVAPINRDQDKDGTDDACDPVIGDAPITPTPSVTPSPSVSVSPTPTVTPLPSPTPVPGAIKPAVISFLSFLKKAITAVVKAIVKVVAAIFG